MKGGSSDAFRRVAAPQGGDDDRGRHPLGLRCAGVVYREEAGDGAAMSSSGWWLVIQRRCSAGVHTPVCRRPQTVSVVWSCCQRSAGDGAAVSSSAGWWLVIQRRCVVLVYTQQCVGGFRQFQWSGAAVSAVPVMVLLCLRLLVGGW